MKKIILSLFTIGFAGLLVSAVAQEDNNPPPPPPDASGQMPGGDVPPEAANAPTPPEASGDQTAATNQMLAADATETADENTATNTADAGPQVITPGKSHGAMDDSADAGFTPPMQAGTNADDLNLNFNRAPLDMVLNYLSDAAGFVIVQDVRVNGTVTVNGKHLTRDEAVDLLNSVLNRNNYAALRDGRTLTIVDKNTAMTSRIPVKNGNNPDDVPNNAEIVTQIIPIRFVEARQLVSDLTSFVSPQATVVANEAGNSIVITDTQANIKHLMEVIKAVDDGAQSETVIKVFHLKHASPTDVASEIASVFPSSGSSGGATQSPIRFGGGGQGGGGFFARMMGAGGAGGGNSGGSSSDRIKKATAVNAVADSRIQAVIVTAPVDLMDQIASMMNDLDVASTRDQKVFVFHMDNGDPQQAASVLQTMFSSTTSRSSSSSANSALTLRAQNNATTTSSSSTTSGFGTTSGSGGRGGGGNQF